MSTPRTPNAPSTPNTAGTPHTAGTPNTVGTVAGRQSGARPGRVSRRVGWLAAACLLLLVSGAALGLLVGNPRLDLTGVVEAWRAPADDPVHVVVVDLRTPRIVLALLAGASLGVAGALLQDSLRNPLAAPELLGVSGGCALVVASVAVLGLPIGRGILPVAATLGGLGIGLGVILVGRRRSDPAVLVLTGLACSTFLTGCVVAVLTLGAPSDVGLFYQYLLGSLANRSWDEVRTILPWAAVCLPLGIALSRRLNVLRLGDDVAASLGVDVLATRRLVLVAACGLTAAVVAVSGPIGFVALIAPHIVRRATRTTNAWVVTIASAAVGGVLLLVADQLGRTFTHPREVAAGVWTVLFGAPVLFVLLRSRTRRGEP
ncbi:FecCD family ABC transporter permease [Phytoactinopolyspora halotolerans]|uniref:Iron ABC transporter permease n=1 Tax=Phytoactinopolyspora halotolerans TaxID=1981512 RepID=A0A6L9SBC4_9ACTN|nr:iron ABC transporter permease [Phytoactinopolyspora halotolerans]NEE01934.1 iron ABC transporter permease [Phytoactinopolyspora halotolerans]